MAHRQLGDEPRAHRWFDEADRWMQKTARDSTRNSSASRRGGAVVAGRGPSSNGDEGRAACRERPAGRRIVPNHSGEQGLSPRPVRPDRSVVSPPARHRPGARPAQERMVLRWCRRWTVEGISNGVRCRSPGCLRCFRIGCRAAGYRCRPGLSGDPLRALAQLPRRAGAPRGLAAGVHLPGGQARRRRGAARASWPCRSTTSSRPWAWPSGRTGSPSGPAPRSGSCARAPDIAPRLEPAGRHDGCFLARTSHFTGDIHAHELAWAGDELWVVNTLFSCLCTLHEDYSFVPRWRPPFVTALAAEDRCHLNGLALAATGPAAYVTALAETDTPEGWRPNKATGGCLIDVADRPDGRPRLRHAALAARPPGPGLAARLRDGPAGARRPGDGRRGDGGRAARLHARPGVPRVASPSSACPRSARPPRSAACRSPSGGQSCGAASASSTCGRAGWSPTWSSSPGVEEIFDVQVLPGVRCPALSGPYPEAGRGADDLEPPRRRPLDHPPSP